MKILIKIRKLIRELRTSNLLTRTPHEIRSRANRQITSTLVTVSRVGRFIYNSLNRENGHKYRQFILPLRNFKDLSRAAKEKLHKKALYHKNDDVIVHCTCPYFKYTLEVALTGYKASQIITSNGAHPRIRNPRRKTYLCKHLVAAVARFDNDVQKHNANKEKSARAPIKDLIKQINTQDNVNDIR